MLYATLVETYERLEATTKRLEMTDILANLLRETEPEELEKVVYLTQGKIHPDWTGEPEIGVAEKMAIEAVSRASGLKKEEVAGLMAETGDIGLAAERALRQKRTGKLGGRRLTVSDIYVALDQIAKESGKGSSGRKLDRLVNLIVDASPLEARYLTRTIVGALRLGVGDMTMLDALSWAYTGSAKNRGLLERAYNVTSDLGYVARTLAESGLEALSEVKATVGKPIRMMLAQRLSTPQETVEK
ncbi:MAG: hypothetical protein ACE5OO_02370, partial [Candidatus Bathyarchaeia archaeon]